MKTEELQDIADNVLDTLYQYNMSLDDMEQVLGACLVAVRIIGDDK